MCGIVDLGRFFAGVGFSRVSILWCLFLISACLVDGFWWFGALGVGCISFALVGLLVGF